MGNCTGKQEGLSGVENGSRKAHARFYVKWEEGWGVVYSRYENIENEKYGEGIELNFLLSLFIFVCRPFILVWYLLDVFFSFSYLLRNSLL